MDLDTYENLIQKRIIAQQNIMNLKKNIDFENQTIERDFINAELDKLIFIDTTKKSSDTLWGENNNFTVNMSGDGLELESDTENYIGVQSLTMSYTWNNIDVLKFNNNTLRYSSNNGSTWGTITFPDGNYTYSDISQYISNYLESQNIDKDGIQILYVKFEKMFY